MQLEPSLRASDRDREQVAERLRHATAEGRLDANELEERLQTLFAARTYGELDAVVADLPAGRSPGRRRVRVAPWVAAAGAFTLVLATLAALITRLHSTVAVAGPIGGTRLRIPGPPPGLFAIRPPIADPTHRLVVVGFMVGAFAALLVSAVLVSVLMWSKGRIGRLNGPTSRSH